MGSSPSEVEMSPKNSNNTRAKRRARDAAKNGEKYTRALRGEVKSPASSGEVKPPASSSVEADASNEVETSYHLDEMARESQITGETWYDDNDEPHYPAEPSAPRIEDPGDGSEYVVKLSHPVTDLDVASRLMQYIRDDNSLYDDLSVEWIGDDELRLSTSYSTFEPNYEDINDALKEVMEEILGDSEEG